MIYIDTNALIRYFTYDDPKKARIVAKYIDSDAKLVLADVVFVEIEYVLQKQYGVTRSELGAHYDFMLNRFSCERHMPLAVATYARTKLDMADCIIAAQSVLGKSQLLTFDSTLKKAHQTLSHTLK